MIKLFGKNYKVRKNSIAYYCIKVVGPAISVLLMIATIYLWIALG